MEVSYTVIYQEQVIKKHIPNLSTNAKKLIKDAIEQKLIIDPLYFGKPLRYSLKGYRSLRVDDYRIVFKIENQEIIIIAIKHRKDVYNI